MSLHAPSSLAHCTRQADPGPNDCGGLASPGPRARQAGTGAAAVFAIAGHVYAQTVKTPYWPLGGAYATKLAFDCAGTHTRAGASCCAWIGWVVVQMVFVAAKYGAATDHSCDLLTSRARSDSFSNNARISRTESLRFRACGEHLARPAYRGCLAPTVFRTCQVRGASAGLLVLRVSQASQAALGRPGRAGGWGEQGREAPAAHGETWADRATLGRKGELDRRGRRGGKGLRVSRAFQDMQGAPDSLGALGSTAGNSLVERGLSAAVAAVDMASDWAERRVLYRAHRHGKSIACAFTGGTEWIFMYMLQPTTLLSLLFPYGTTLAS